MTDTPPYMSPAQPGALLTGLGPGATPPTAAPGPILTRENVTEPPLSAVVRQNASAPTAEAPTTPNGQHKTTVSALVSLSAFIVAVALLFC